MHRGCFVWTPNPPLAGRRTPRPGPVRVCVCLLFLASSGGPASQARFSAPHLFLLAALSFRFAWPPLGWSCPCFGPLFALPSPLLLFVFFSPLLSFLRPLCLLLSLVSGPGCPRPWRCVLFVLLALRFLSPCVLSLLCRCLAVGCFLVVAPPPPFCVSPCCRRSVPQFFLFFLLFCTPPLSPAFLGFRPWVPWASALRVVFFFCLLPLCSSCALACFLFPPWPLAAPWWLLPPPPLPFCFSLPLGALGLFFFSSCVRPCCPRPSQRSCSPRTRALSRAH